MMCNGSESPLAALTEKLGGESQFNSLIMMFSASALKDLELHVAFKGMDAEALADHMINLIKMVFGYACKSSMVNSVIRGQIVLRNFAIFELGLRRGQLHKLHLIFEDALSDSFAGEEVLDCCMDRFIDLCKIVQTESRSYRQNENSRSTRMSSDPAMIMTKQASSRSLLVVSKAA